MEGLGKIVNEITALFNARICEKSDIYNIKNHLSIYIVEVVFPCSKLEKLNQDGKKLLFR